LVKQLLYSQLIRLIHEFNSIKFYHTANAHIPSHKHITNIIQNDDRQKQSPTLYK